MFFWELVLLYILLLHQYKMPLQRESPSARNYMGWLTLNSSSSIEEFPWGLGVFSLSYSFLISSTEIQVWPKTKASRSASKINMYWSWKKQSKQNNVKHTMITKVIHFSSSNIYLAISHTKLQIIYTKKDKTLKNITHKHIHLEWKNSKKGNTSKYTKKGGQQ